MGGSAMVRRSAQQWKALVERYERGTATQARFCAREGVSVGALQYWRRRLREEAAGGDAAALAIARLVAVQVREEAPAPKETGLRLVLSSGVSVEVAPDFDAATLRRVIDALGARP
jgi:transposase-like protein